MRQTANGTAAKTGILISIKALNSSRVVQQSLDDDGNHVGAVAILAAAAAGAAVVAESVLSPIDLL